MANNLGSLVVSLGLDAAEFTRGLTKSEYQTQQWVRRFETGIEAARTGALAAFAAMGSAAMVLNQQLEGIAGFQDLADKMGDTAEQVASLKPAADVSGTALEEAAAASVKLTSALAKTDDESKGVGAALKAIGLEMDEFKRLTPVAQIDAVAQALAKYEDGAGKTAVAVQLFGKSGADLIPMLNDLAELGGRQVTLTGEQIQAADEYSKSTARLRSELQTLVQVTAADAAPVMTQMVQILRDITTYASASSGGFNVLAATLDGAKVVLQTVVVLGADVAYVFKQTGVEIGGMAAQLAALMRMDFSGFTAISAAMKEDAARARAELDAFQARVLGGGSGAGSQASYSNEGRNYAPRPQTIKFTPVVPRLPAQRAGLAKAAKVSDPLGDFIDSDGVQAAIKRTDDMARAAARAVDQTRTPLERLTAEQEDLLRLKELGYLQDEDYMRAARESVEKYESTVRDVKSKTADAVDDAKRLGDAFAGTFKQAFDEGMKFGDLLKKLAFDYVNTQVLTPATQKIGSTLGSVLGDLLTFDGGGYTGSGSRSGGMDGKGGFLAMLHPNETVLDHTRGQGTGSSGGTAVITQTFNFGNATADTVAQLRAEAARIKAETLAAVPATMIQAVKGSTGVARAIRGG